MLNQEQIKFANDDIKKVKEMLDIAFPYLNLIESLWETDPVDAILINTKDKKFMRYAEIKGRRISSDLYGDIIVDTKKIDFINNHIKLLQQYGIKENIGGLLFYVFHTDNKIAIIRTDIYAQKSELLDQVCKKSMATEETTLKHLYKLNIFDSNKNITDGVLLFDLNKKTFIRNK